MHICLSSKMATDGLGGKLERERRAKSLAKMPYQAPTLKIVLGDHKSKCRIAWRLIFHGFMQKTR